MTCVAGRLRLVRQPADFTRLGETQACASAAALRCPALQQRDHNADDAWGVWKILGRGFSRSSPTSADAAPRCALLLWRRHKRDI